MRRSSAETIRTLSTRTPLLFRAAGVRVRLFRLAIAPFRRTTLSTAVIAPYPALAAVSRGTSGVGYGSALAGAQPRSVALRRDVLPQATQPSPRSGLRSCDTVTEAAGTPRVQHSLQAVPGCFSAGWISDKRLPSLRPAAPSSRSLATRLQFTAVGCISRAPAEDLARVVEGSTARPGWVASLPHKGSLDSRAAHGEDGVRTRETHQGRLWEPRCHSPDAHLDAVAAGGSLTSRACPWCVVRAAHWYRAADAVHPVTCEGTQRCLSRAPSETRYAPQWCFTHVPDRSCIGLDRSSIIVPE